MIGITLSSLDLVEEPQLRKIERYIGENLRRYQSVTENFVVKFLSRRIVLNGSFISKLCRMEDVKLAYPSKEDPEAVEVEYQDLGRLAPLEFLNDTIIDFYIKYVTLCPVPDRFLICKPTLASCRLLPNLRVLL